MEGLILPYRVGKVKLTSKYGLRKLNGADNRHNGVDLQGTDKILVAPCDGVVVSSTQILDTNNRTWEWGNYVRIDRADGLQIFMCHMSERRVKVGDVVKAGDVVGVEGNTGFSFGTHVHFEVRRNGEVVNPCPYLEIENTAWEIDVVERYAELVCARCGFEAKTRAYMDEYKFAPDLWRKLWLAM